MKKAITLLGIAIAMLSCQQEEVPPPAQNNPTTQSNCNSEEAALVGKWFLRQTCVYMGDTLLPSSVASYNSQQQYVQFNDEVDATANTTWPGAKRSTWSPMGTASSVSWRCSGDTLKVPAGSATHRVTYIDTDSLVLDYGLSADSSQFNRYILHK